MGPASMAVQKIKREEDTKRCLRKQSFLKDAMG